MDMVERVARALSPSSWDEGPNATDDHVARQCREDGRVISLLDARAAIEAMREPTEAMLTAGVWNDSEAGFTKNPPNIWGAMIDAALYEPVESR